MTGEVRTRALKKAALLAVAVIVLDQISKWVILTQVMDPPRVIEVTGFFNLVLAWNRGVSFGMFGGGAVPPWGLSVMAAVIVTGLGIWLWRAPEKWLTWGIGLIAGGAVGNVIDRLNHGAVADFLDFHALGYHWPAFNVADMGITVGAAVLVLDSLFHGAETPKTDKASSSEAQDGPKD